MSKITNLFLVQIVALILAACTSSPARVESVVKCPFPETDKAAPSWMCDASAEGMTVGAVGYASRSDAGIAFMKQAAAVEAYDQLAQNMKVQVQRMIGQYAKAAGAGSKEAVDRVVASVLRQITPRTLQGARIFKSILAPDGTMFVLVGLDDAAVQSLTETAVKISMNDDQAAWQHLNTQISQDELAAEIAKQKVATPAH